MGQRSVPIVTFGAFHLEPRNIKPVGIQYNQPDDPAQKIKMVSKAPLGPNQRRSGASVERRVAKEIRRSAETPLRRWLRSFKDFEFFPDRAGRLSMIHADQR